jgi:hypothetical protein
MGTPFGAVTSVGQLMAGTYTFQITVTGDQNVIATATVHVTVKSDLRFNGATARIFPNPVVQDQVTVNATNSSRGPVMITIYDMNGRQVQAFEFDKQEDVFMETLNMKALSKGTYILSVRFTGISRPATFELVKQ